MQKRGREQTLKVCQVRKESTIAIFFTKSKQISMFKFILHLQALTVSMGPVQNCFVTDLAIKIMTIFRTPNLRGNLSVLTSSSKCATQRVYQDSVDTCTNFSGVNLKRIFQSGADILFRIQTLCSLFDATRCFSCCCCCCKQCDQLLEQKVA